MSDMIDRLRAISAGAGRDIATDLAAPATIESMAGRVRHGVRRRRIRLGAIGVSAAAVVGAAAIAAPALLNSLPNQPDVIQPGIVRTVGPITTYDNDSYSVVLSSGEMMNLPPYEGDLVFTQASRGELCTIASPDELPSGTWVSTTSASNRIIGQAKLGVKDDTGVKKSVLDGMTIEVADPKGAPPGFVASFQVDPAVAPFIAIKTTVVEFKVERSESGAKSYWNVMKESTLEGEPNPEYSGSADLGTRVGTVESRPMTMYEWGTCYEEYYADTLDPTFWTGTFEWYVVAEIYLVDHKGGAYPLGTSTYRLSADVSA
jgi:hypothetical protein